MEAETERAAVESVELDLLIDGVRRRHDLDLGVYARPLLMRRVRGFMAAQGLESISRLQASALRYADVAKELAASVASGPATLFQDPEFYRAFRAFAVPWLRTHPSVRIWHAGCPAPEELYSLLIVLHDEGLLKRTRVYVTDASEALLGRVKAAWLPPADDGAQSRYEQAGGTGTLTASFEESGGRLHLRQDIDERLFIVQHDLTREAPLNEFHAVLCRDSLLCLSRFQRVQAHSKIFTSLAPRGFLGLGRKESLHGTRHAVGFDEYEGSGRLFRRLS